MKRPKLEDTPNVSTYQYSILQDKYIDYLESKLNIVSYLPTENEIKAITCKHCGRPREDHSFVSKMCMNQFSFFEPIASR